MFLLRLKLESSYLRLILGLPRPVIKSHTEEYVAVTIRVYWKLVQIGETIQKAVNINIEKKCKF